MSAGNDRGGEVSLAGAWPQLGCEVERREMPRAGRKPEVRFPGNLWGGAFETVKREVSAPLVSVCVKVVTCIGYIGASPRLNDFFI